MAAELAQRRTCLGTTSFHDLHPQGLGRSLLQQYGNQMLPGHNTMKHLG